MIYTQGLVIGFVASIFVYFLTRVGKTLKFSDKVPVKFLFIIVFGTVAGLGYWYLYRIILLDAYLLGLLYSLGLWMIVMVIIMPIRGYGVFGLKESRQVVLSTLIFHAFYGFLLGLLISL